MGTIGKRILTAAVGLLLAGGVPHVAATAAHADPGAGCGCGCRCDCPCGEKAGCGHGDGCDCGGRRGKHEGMHEKDGAGHEKHMHGGKTAGGPPMKEGMARHMEEMRAMIGKLRAIEAKMEGLKSKDDEAAFRAASLEHAKLLTGLQESHLKHMEGMMGSK